MLLGSTRELSSTWPDGQFDYGATPIQTSNFSCTEPNTYITNTLNKLIFFPELSTFPVFVMRTQLVLIFWNKMAGREGRYVFSCFEGTKYTCLMRINHFCMQWECRRLESRQFGGVLRVMFLRENDRINESWRNRQQERTWRGTVMFLWE